MIRKNIEYETKLLLSREEYEKICAHYQGYKSRHILITNIYYDTLEVSLITNGYLFRTRNSNDEEYELTLKIAGKDGNIEHNIPIDKDAYDKYEKSDGFVIPESLRKEVVKFNIPDHYLYKKCVLKTNRIEIPMDEHLLVLDHNTYNGIEDYNIEIESTSMEQADAILKNLCHTFFIKYQAHSPGKSRRAIATIKKEGVK